MVACTTTGNPWDSVFKRPGQTSTYYRYGPWHCHVSAPPWGLLWTGGVNKKKQKKRRQDTGFGDLPAVVEHANASPQKQFLSAVAAQYPTYPYPQDTQWTQMREQGLRPPKTHKVGTIITDAERFAFEEYASWANH